MHSESQAEEVLAPRSLPPKERESWGSFLRTMAWVGINTFGGPVAQIGFMHKVAVEQRRWLTDGQFVHLLNFANVLPGPEALEISIHLGYLRRGIWGGIVAGLLFIWPGFISLTALAWRPRLLTASRIHRTPRPPVATTAASWWFRPRAPVILRTCRPPSC